MRIELAVVSNVVTDQLPLCDAIGCVTIS
jgi:hypothetical protein